MQIILAILEITALMMLLTAFMALFVKAYNKLRTSEGDIKIGCLLSAFFIIAVFVLVYIVASGFVEETIDKLLIAFPIISIANYLLIQRIQKIMLTRKASMKAGPREFKYNGKYLSAAAFIMAAILFYLYLRVPPDVPENELTDLLMGLCFFLAGIGVYIRKLPNIYSNQVSDLEKLQQIPFVLFFRNFKDEQYPFYLGRYLPEFNAKLKGIRAKLSSIDISNANFEFFFSSQFKKYIGELVGFGNPEELMPHEHIKLFYKINDWKDSLKPLLISSQCIVMQPSLSAGIEYELTEIKNSGAAHKLFFLQGRQGTLSSRAFWAG